MGSSKIRYHILSIMAPCLMLLFGTYLCQDTYAALAATDGQLYELSLLSGLQQCYQAGVKDKIQVSDFSGFNSILSKPNNKVYITTHIGNTLNGNSDNDLKCSEVINGYKADKASNSAKGIKQVLKDASTPEEAGYKFVQSTGESDTIKITMNDFQGNTSRNKVTFEGSIEVSNAGNSGATCAGQISANYNGNTIAFVTCPNGTEIIASGPVQAPYDFIYTYMRSNEQIKDEIITDFTTFVYNYSNYDDYPFLVDTNELSGNMTAVNNTDGNSQMASYEPISSGSSIAGIALKKIGASNSIPGCSGGSLFTDGVSYDTVSCGFSDSLTYALYYRYVQDNDGLQIQECGTQKAEGAAYYIKNSANTWCTIAVTDSNALSDSYSVVSRSKLTDGNMQTVLNWLSDENSYKYIKDENYADATVSDDGTVTPPASDTDGGNNYTEDACFKSSGAMGWILCPVINMLQDAGNRMWNAIEEHLMVDSDLYKFGGEVNSVWSTMQGISNVVFIIIILMIVFSQVTGVGIDNYGIKKMLPRIITAAVLANLSFIICALVLDASNIVGSSLNSWLTNMSPALPQTGAGAVGEATGSIVGLAIGGGVYFLFEFLATGSWLGAGLGLALLVLTVLLTIVVAMATLYITLIVRKALVIMVIIVAPVALALYILPNTEKWFKKWLQIGGALVLLYPLCGLVVGGGKLAGNILASAGQAASTKSVVLAGMIAQVAPFFFIPTLLTNSMKGIGNIGGKLMSGGRGLGKRFSGATNRAVGTGIRNSNRFKDMTSSENRNRLERRLRSMNQGNTLDGDARTDLSASQLRRRASIMAALNKDTQERANAQYGVQSTHLSEEQAQANAVAEATASRISLARQSGGILSDNILGQTTRDANNRITGFNSTATTGLQGAINRANSIYSAAISGGQTDAQARNSREYLEARAQIQEYTKALAAEKDGVTTLAQLADGQSGAGWGELSRTIQNDGRLAANVKKFGNSTLHQGVQGHANANGTATDNSMDSAILGAIDGLNAGDFVGQASGTIARDAELAAQIREGTADLSRLGLTQVQANEKLQKLQSTVMDSFRNANLQPSIDQKRAASMAEILSQTDLDDIMTDPEANRKYNQTIIHAVTVEHAKRAGGPPPSPAP